jgi:hypothetical protein
VTTPKLIHWTNFYVELETVPLLIYAHSIKLNVWTQKGRDMHCIVTHHMVPCLLCTTYHTRGEWMMSLQEQLIAHPHLLLVRATNEQFLPVEGALLELV